MLQESAASASEGYKIVGWVMKAKNHSHGTTIAASWWEETKIDFKRALSRMTGRFNKRFVFIDLSLNIICYANNTYAKRFAFIPFIDLMGVDYLKTAQQISNAKPGWLHGIVITTKSRQFEIWVRTKEECDRWMRTLEKAVELGRTIRSAKNSTQLNSRLQRLSMALLEDASPIANAPLDSFTNSFTTVQTPAPALLS